ncbi:MAG: 30S ribosomal protein S18 [Actinomycetes bacterium]
MPSSRPTPRREKKGKAGVADPSRRRSCTFCKEKTDEVDFKDFPALRRLTSEKGKIRSRRITGACPRHQNQVAVAVKRAREMALLPNAGR